MADYVSKLCGVQGGYNVKCILGKNTENDTVI